tara:strand:+ start:4963 stop:5844 length:882 start_codon:yes stop_codon:yes gene_type:complete
MSFSDFKKRSQNSLGDLTSKLEAMNKKDSYKDDRFWRPELDSSSNGYAVVRFLDTAKDEDMPFVKYYSHGFQGPGGWYIENSRTTFGEKDPVSEMNSKLWNTGAESDKDIARQRKRRTNFVSNIMVISDPANPSNEGKVFLYRYGQKIHNKIIEVMQPEFQDEEPVNPFDMWKGADFKLKIRKVSGFINYDKSEFASPSPLLEGNDDALERIWNQQYPLNEFIDPSNYKSYDDLKSRLNEVLGNDIRLTMNENKTKDNIETAEIKEDVPNTESSDSVDASDALSYFEKLASED